MEVITVSWKSEFEVPYPNSPKRYYFTQAYQSFAVQRSDVPIVVTVGAGAGAERVYRVEAGSVFAVTADIVFDSVEIALAYAPPILRQTLTGPAYALSVLAFYETDISNLVATLLPSETPQQPEPLVSLSGSNMIEKPPGMPLARVLADMAVGPSGQHQSNLHAADIISDPDGGFLLATGPYAKQGTVWKPVSTADPLPVAAPSPLPVTASAAFPVSVQDPVARRYGAVIPGRSTSFPAVSSTSFVPIVALQASTKAVIITDILFWALSLSVATAYTVSLQRFTGTVTGGTAVTPVPYNPSSGESSFSVAYGTGLSVTGVISTARSAYYGNGATGGPVSVLPQPIRCLANEGYVLQYASSASATLTYACVVIVLEE